METSTPPKRRGRRCAVLVDPPNRMRELREREGYSLRGFARMLDVFPQSLLRYETEGRGISRETIFQACDILDVDPRILDRRPSQHKIFLEK